MKPPSPRQLARLSRLFAVLSDPVRLRILHCLGDGPRSVTEIALTCGLKQPNTSKHLRVLRDAAIVAGGRDGVVVRYEIVEPLVLDICETVCRGWSD
jgi:DNA-binding transcriptional ArsR family regulator